jgi:hypothetical protein
MPTRRARTATSPQRIRAEAPKPEYRAIVETTRRERPRLADDVLAVVEAMLTATDSNGQPDLALRARGAELRRRFRAAFEAASDDDLDNRDTTSPQNRAQEPSEPRAQSKQTPSLTEIDAHTAHPWVRPESRGPVVRGPPARPGIDRPHEQRRAGIVVVTCVTSLTPLGASETIQRQRNQVTSLGAIIGD